MGMRPFSLVVFCLCCSVALAEETTNPPAKLVDGPMAKLAPILGTWEIDAEWLGGDPIKARNEYTVGLNGRFVYAKTFAESGGGGVYQRYFTVFGYDDERQQYMSWGFTYDGTSMTVPLQVEEDGDHLVITSQWDNARTGPMKQAVTIGDEQAYGWKVWKKTQDGEWLRIMDNEWKKVTE